MRLAACLAFFVLALSLPASAQDPRVPAGKDPGGAAVALLTRGLDYTRPEIAKLLARDGEGELIGWDFVDNDNRPFVKGDGVEADVELAKALGAAGGVRIIPVRVDPGDSVSLARAAVFAAKTPARVLVVPFSSGDKDHWETFATAVKHLTNLMVVVPATDAQGMVPSFPAALELPSALSVSNRKVEGLKSDVVIERRSPEAAAVAAPAIFFGCRKLSLKYDQGPAMKAELVNGLTGTQAEAAAKACGAANGSGQP